MILKILKDKNRFHETLFMGIISVICFGFSIFRFFYTETKVFLFLNWNLFLAFIPWAVTSIAILKPKLQDYKLTVFILLSVWLLFFPNAPYIFTDLFHLRLNSKMPKWFDLILILSFAWTGLLFGLLSLWDIESILSKFFSSIWIRVISICLLFISSFGIYLGRYLRWNSWDIIQDPFGLLQDIGDRIVNPTDHPKTWGVTLFMGMFLTIVYLSCSIIQKRNSRNS